MTPQDEAECRRVALEYATTKNEWDILKHIFDRLRDGMHVAPKRAALVEGLTAEEFTRRHVAMFAAYIYPRERKYGSSPGKPSGISRDGPFEKVSEQSIVSVIERNKNTIEVITQWPYMATQGETMFVMKKKDGRWLIDSLKSNHDGSAWENQLL